MSTPRENCLRIIRMFLSLLGKRELRSIIHTRPEHFTTRKYRIWEDGIKKFCMIGAADRTREPIQDYSVSPWMINRLKKAVMDGPGFAPYMAWDRLAEDIGIAEAAKLLHMEAYKELYSRIDPSMIDESVPMGTPTFTT